MRLIDANDFIEKMHELYEQAKWGKREIHFSLADLECNVDMMPTIDAVPVIRCKDCKYASMTYDDECKYCDIWFPDEAIYLDGDNFCSAAERKEE